MDDGRGDVAGEWVDLGQFARRLGIARSSVYGRVRRGTLQTRPKGNRGQTIRDCLLVLTDANTGPREIKVDLKIIGVVWLG